MAGVKTPTVFRAGRKLGLEGVTYQPGDFIPNAVIGRIHRLSALMSRGWIKGEVDRRGRTRVSRHPGPLAFTPRERVSMALDVTPPPVPTGVAAANGTGSSVVTWTAVTGDVASYRIYRGGALVGTVAHPTTSYTDTVAAGTYTYTVSSRDTTGNESAQSAGDPATVA